MSAPTATPPQLVWQRGDGTTAAFVLEAAIMLVGREDDADIRVDEPLVSRNHARIERRGDRYFVLDLGSTNLTRVNGDVVRERELKDGDEVRFGRAVCRFMTAPPEKRKRTKDSHRDTETQRTDQEETDAE